MLRLLAIAGAGALSAVGSAHAVLYFEAHAAKAGVERPVMVVAAKPPPNPAASQAGYASEIPKGPDGHFWAEAQVNGGPVKFLVDTGASAVSLSAKDAARLGYDPARLEYGYTVTTASGTARAAKITLASVAVGSAQVQNVEAFVIESGLETSLLGMTYLGRLSGFEATSQGLILKP